jgi:hypothetical protein
MTFEKISSEKFADKQISTSQMTQVKGGGDMQSTHNVSRTRSDQYDYARKWGYWEDNGREFWGMQGTVGGGDTTTSSSSSSSSSL